jgi:hypothetical protein
MWRLIILDICLNDRIRAKSHFVRQALVMMHHAAGLASSWQRFADGRPVMTPGNKLNKLLGLCAELEF